MQNSTDPQWPQLCHRAAAKPGPSCCWHPKCDTPSGLAPAAWIPLDSPAALQKFNIYTSGIAQRLLSPTCFLPICNNVTFQENLPIYRNWNVSTCTENAEVNVKESCLFTRGGQHWDGSHKSITPLPGFHWQLKHIWEKHSVSNWGKRLHTKLSTCGGKPFLQGFWETLLQSGTD